MTGASAQPPLVLVGAGGHAKVVIEVARAESRFDVAFVPGDFGGGYGERNEK